MTYSLRARGVVHDDQPALGGDGLLGRGEARGGGEGARGQGVHGKARERGRVLEWRATATATARDPLWITWFRIREEIYPVYDPWVRELFIDARVIHTWFRTREEIYPRKYDPWVRELFIDARVIHTWFRTREEIYPRKYDPWVRELFIDARVIHACLVCVAHGVCRWMSMGSGALVGWNVKIFSSGWVLFWRRD